MKAHTTPMVVTDLGQDTEGCFALEALPLQKSKSVETLYDERWLQQLIQRQPSLLPVRDIEPALTPLVPVCMELLLPSGFADNLLLTPDGGIVLVEAKLWRNPQARREVVGQVLDYAKDLARMDYEKLEAAVNAACKDGKQSLFSRVCGPDADPDDEPVFADAVTRNLRLGRFLLIIAGDGIQESAEQLADFLQRHMSLHFSLAMVEISLWRAPQSGQIFVQPKVLTRTVQIERAVIRVPEGVALEAPIFTPASPQAKSTTLSEEGFYEALEAVDPTLPAKLQAFLKEVEPLDVFSDLKKAMSLKWKSPEGQVFQLGVIDRDGRFTSDHAHWPANAIGRIDLSHAYEATLAAAVPGAKVKKTPKETGWRIVLADKLVPVAALLDHKDVWIEAIETYTAALREVLDPGQSGERFRLGRLNFQR